MKKFQDLNKNYSQSKSSKLATHLTQEDATTSENKEVLEGRQVARQTSVMMMVKQHRKRRHCAPKATNTQPQHTSLSKLLFLLIATSTLFTLFNEFHQLFSSTRHKQLQLFNLVDAASQPQALRQVSQTSSANLHQAMSQMLQVFSGNESQSLDSNNFKLLELMDEDTLLVGAR